MLKDKIIDAVREFIADDVTESDNIMLAVDRQAQTAELIDADESDIDADPRDIYSAMDLIEMSVEQPGTWVPDMDAIDEISLG